MEIFKDTLAFFKNLSSKASTDFPLSLKGRLKKSNKKSQTQNIKNMNIKCLAWSETAR